MSTAATPGRRRRWPWWLGGALIALAIVGLLSRGFIAEKLTLKRSADAYLIGYPLVSMTATREALVEPPAQMNAFSHARYLPDGRSSVQVVAPSRDTYYSSAWLDLTDGPVVIDQPDMGERFWLMPVLDAWTNVIADPGTRTLGNGPHRIVIAGPDWQGEPPPESQVYRSPTNLAWAILRITAGPGIAALQDGFRMAHLSDLGSPSKAAVFEAPRSTKDVRAEVDGLSGQEFFTKLADALETVPVDADAAATLAKAGVTPGTFTAPTGSAAEGLAQTPGRVQTAMTEAITSGEGSTVINGWRVPPMILGDYGTQYPTRAVVAREGLGANLPADAVYASTTVDSAGEPLTGGRTYRVDVPADVPVRAFWSVSLYDDHGNFLPGATKGLSVSGGPNEKAVVITVAPKPVAGPWLRSPTTGSFRLLMRLYWPQQSVLDNAWTYPTVSAVD